MERPDRPVPRASIRDTVRALSQVTMPLIAKGVIARRPRVMQAAERMDTNARGVKVMQQLADRYDGGPVVLRMPWRTMTLVFTTTDVARILDGSPEPFATANLEKRYALRHFQAHNSLISHDERDQRRPFNEHALDQQQPMHAMAEPIVAKTNEEAQVLVDQVHAEGALTWHMFIDAWWRVVRRVVLGDAARDDHALTDMLTDLRHDANWSFVKPRRDRLRRRFRRQLQGHLDRAEPGSLAERISAMSGGDADGGDAGRVAPAHQVPQWLFAYDPAGMASYRALALLAAHGGDGERARSEAADGDPSGPRLLPFLRATVLESLRLWPTTPAILRDTTTPTTWRNGVLPEGAAILIYAPYFHRDERRLPAAHGFVPEQWLQMSLDSGPEEYPLVPFSGGVAECPGRNLVLLTTSTFLAAIWRQVDLRVDEPQLNASDPLPGTLSPFDLRFSAAERISTPTPGTQGSHGRTQERDPNEGDVR